MYARVSTFDGPAGLTDEQIEGMNQDLEASVLPKVRAMDGYKGLLSLIDTSTGKAISVTLWESEDAMVASEAEANSAREEAAEIEQSQVRAVERFRVALFETG